MSKLNKGTVKALILTGGLSKRMGEDKSQINYFGINQVNYLYRLLESHPLIESVLISCRKDQGDEEHFKSLNKVYDSFDISGPLNGILSCLKESKEKEDDCSWLIISCDLPLVRKSNITNLIEANDHTKVATTYLSKEQKLPEPMFTIYNPSFLNIGLDFIDQGVKCPRKMLINSETADLSIGESNFLENVNTQEDKNYIQKEFFKKVTVKYFAALRDQSGISEEVIQGLFKNSSELFEQLSLVRNITLPKEILRVARNEEYIEFDSPLNTGDVIVFIPPVAGG